MWNARKFSQHDFLLEFHWKFKVFTEGLDGKCEREKKIVDSVAWHDDAAVKAKGKSFDIFINYNFSLEIIYLH